MKTKKLNILTLSFILKMKKIVFIDRESVEFKGMPVSLKSGFINRVSFLEKNVYHRRIKLDNVTPPNYVEDCN